MPFDAERRGLKPILGMTILAAIVIGGTLKLAAVGIPVAGGAGCARSPIDHPAFPGGMAFDAGRFPVATPQRKWRGLVPREAECRRLESRDRMARGAVPSVGPCVELPSMGILLVAAVTAPEGHRLLEIGPFVTCGAGNPGVFAEQREVGGRMIECRGVWPDRLPGSRFVAGPARAPKGAAVRIRVTGGAILVRNPTKPDVGLRLLHCRVAFGAGDLLVPSVKEKAGATVVESRSRFPVPGGVAQAAVRRQLAAMGIAVTAIAPGRQTQERARQIGFRKPFP